MAENKNKTRGHLSSLKIKLDPYLAAAGSDRRSIYAYKESDLQSDEYEYAFELSVLKERLLRLKIDICNDRVQLVSSSKEIDIEEIDQKLTYIDRFFYHDVDPAMPSSEFADMPWKDRARLVAEQFFRGDRNLTVDQLAKLVEEDFKSKGVLNEKGKMLIADTIKRGALAGVTTRKT